MTSDRKPEWLWWIPSSVCFVSAFLVMLGDRGLAFFDLAKNLKEIVCVFWASLFVCAVQFVAWLTALKGERR